MGSRGDARESDHVNYGCQFNSSLFIQPLLQSKLSPGARTRVRCRNPATDGQMGKEGGDGGKARE